MIELAIKEALLLKIMDNIHDERLGTQQQQQSFCSFFDQKRHQAC